MGRSRRSTRTGARRSPAPPSRDPEACSPIGLEACGFLVTPSGSRAPRNHHRLRAARGRVNGVLGIELRRPAWGRHNRSFVHASHGPVAGGRGLSPATCSRCGAMNGNDFAKLGVGHAPSPAGRGPLVARRSERACDRSSSDLTVRAPTRFRRSFASDARGRCSISDAETEAVTAEQPRPRRANIDAATHPQTRASPI